MKVILRQDIQGLGHQGDVKEVSRGHARNYLIPRNMVWEADSANMKLLEKEKEKFEKRKLATVQAAKDLAAEIEKLSTTIEVKTGEGGKLFGSVTNADIAAALDAKGFKIDKHNISLENPIKEVGIFSVSIKLHPDVFAKAKVWIVEEKK
jgi:large subunit ribosomal protein L9